MRHHEFGGVLRHLNHRRALPRPAHPPLSFHFPWAKDSAPAQASVQQFIPAAKDQGQLSSCSAFSHVGMLRTYAKMHGTDIDLSELQLYHDTLAEEGSAGVDAGATNPDVGRTLATKGICQEALWPYDPSKFALEPAGPARADAASRPAATTGLSSLDDVRRAISGGCGAVMGISVYESMQSDAVAKTGEIPMPAASEKFLGGHDLFWFAYDASWFYYLNSWGRDWGGHGIGRAPIAFMEQFSFDFETVLSVTGV